MSDIEYHVVLVCPMYWTDTTARIFAERLRDTETQTEVGVFLWTLEDGRIVNQDVLRETDGVDDAA
jgi:hypothetical protein